MTLSLTSAHQWRISTRTRGEVLTASARSEECQLLVLMAGGGQSAPELEGWLGDLIGVATEGTRTDQSTRPIPTLLHHALTALLFSHREVWNSTPPGSNFSLAFVQSGEDVAFGWVGDVEPRVWIDDHPAAGQWVRVRDHGGREAFAFSAKAAGRVRVSLEWHRSSEGAEDAAQVEALWGAADGSTPASGGREPEAAPFTMAEVLAPWTEGVAASPSPASAAVEGAGSPRPAIAGPDQPSAALAPSPAAEPALPELIPPSPEPADLTALALQSQVADPDPPDAGAGSQPAAAAGDLAIAPAAMAPAPAQEVPQTPSTVAGSAAEIPGEAASAPPRQPRQRPRMRPAWPSEHELERSRRRGRGNWLWVVAAVLAAGLAYAFGLYPGFDHEHGKAPGLELLGLGAARFELSVQSRPPGAWIAADGKDLTQRTPATIQLSAGEHQIALSFPDLGNSSFQVRGVRGDRQTMSAPLWGSLSVGEADANVPVAVELDGDAVGTAPLSVDSLAPGAHELRFTGPGLTPWGQTLRVHVGENAEVVARPMTSPANGVLEVRATFTDGNGTNVLTGASVWVDGEHRGVTPLVLELPRGPHSARVEYRGERTPVEVIDLPGGNQRFASFELGVNPDAPTLETAPLPAAVPLGRPNVVAADLNGVSANDVREMWLNVREPEGTWRRYQMVMLKAPGGVVGVAVFPVALFDSHGSARYYVSATDQTGDDYFTEILSAHSAPKQGTAR